MNPIETPRLLIRNFTANDGDVLHEMILRYEASEFAPYDHEWPTSLQEIQGVAEWFASGDSFLAVCLKDSGRFIGFVALNEEQGQEALVFNLGYIFHSDYHGKGYATEACRALLGYAFDRLQADKLICGTARENLASCRMLEKLGFKKTREGMGSFRNDSEGHPIEFVGYTFVLSKAEWQAGTPA